MKFKSNNFELKFAVAQVLDVFNDITIDRFDRAGKVSKTIKVPCLYGNKSRILKSLESRDKMLELPMIVISRGGLSRDSQRISNLKRSLYKSMGNKTDHHERAPSPMNINFNMTILCRYTADLDQIITNFIPFMTPAVYVSWPHPFDAKTTIKSQLRWEGSIDETHPTDIGETDAPHVEATTDLIYKTLIFAGTKESFSKVDPNKNRIERINFNGHLLSMAPPDTLPADLDQYGYGLSNFYAVPQNMTFTEFKGQIVKGFIKDFDRFQLQAGVSGFWQDIKGLVAEASIVDAAVDVDKYVIDDKGNLLLLTDGTLSSNMQEVSYLDFYDEQVQYFNNNINNIN